MNHSFLRKIKKLPVKIRLVLSGPRVIVSEVCSKRYAVFVQYHLWRDSDYREFEILREVNVLHQTIPLGPTAPLRPTKKLVNKRNNSKKVLREDAARKREKRRYYRNQIVAAVAPFFIGSILMSFLETFGLGAFVACLLLCLLVALIARAF